MTAPDETFPRESYVRPILVILLTRTVLNVAYRAVYPFLPFIAADLNVSFQSAAEIVQSRNLIGLLAPLFGPLSDGYGRRVVMLAGLAVGVVACLGLGLFNSFLFAVLAIALVSLGKALYDPAQQAYLGDRVPYAERGRAVSLSEISWSAASLIGLPLFGIVVKYAGWRPAFVLAGVVLLFALGLARIGLVELPHPAHSERLVSWRRSLALALREPVALALLLTALLNAAANENINIVYAEWMQNSFLLDSIALGLVAGAMGLAELGGELASTGLADRMGKHRLVAVSLLLSAGGNLLLPFIARNAALGTLGLVLVFGFFEVSVVSAIPLASEVIPSARGTLLSLNVAAFALGRTAGSFSGPFLFSSWGLAANGIVSAVSTITAAAIWLALVHDYH